MPAFFVTGTDTEIGKTTIAAGLLHAARSCSLHTSDAAVDLSRVDISSSRAKTHQNMNVKSESRFRP
ncbi:AAA family ATPase, partial [Pseudomonas aeruginosa]|uniref:AAA family ATPase n=1 Tax=Pseudomonas aeruginosa TaxID=287 RepID=UPI003F5D50BE